MGVPGLSMAFMLLALLFRSCGVALAGYHLESDPETFSFIFFDDSLTRILNSSFLSLSSFGSHNNLERPYLFSSIIASYNQPPAPASLELTAIETPKNYPNFFNFYI